MDWNWKQKVPRNGVELGFGYYLCLGLPLSLDWKIHLFSIFLNLNLSLFGAEGNRSGLEITHSSWKTPLPGKSWGCFLRKQFGPGYFSKNGEIWHDWH